MFDLEGPELNVLIRDKISFVGVAHLMCGGRSCSWVLYRSHQLCDHLWHLVTSVTVTSGHSFHCVTAVTNVWICSSCFNETQEVCQKERLGFFLQICLFLFGIRSDQSGNFEGGSVCVLRLDSGSERLSAEVEEKLATWNVHVLNMILSFCRSLCLAHVLRRQS